MKNPHPSEAWELKVLEGAVIFTAFIQVAVLDRRREEFNSYAAACAQALAWAEQFGHPGLVYAINAAGRSVLVTPRLAELAGFQKITR